MEIVRNNKGGQKCFNGFMYNQQNSTQNAIYWRCTKFNSGCSGRLKTDLAISLSDILSDHNHESDTSKVNATKARAEMKRLATESEENV